MGQHTEYVDEIHELSWSHEIIDSLYWRGLCQPGHVTVASSSLSLCTVCWKFGWNLVISPFSLFYLMVNQDQEIYDIESARCVMGRGWRD